MTQPSINIDILHGIYEYLKTRVDHIFIYNNYIEVHRKRSIITITITDNLAELEKRGLQPEGTSQTQHYFDRLYSGPGPKRRTTINMQSPDSLQKIFEWIMSKQNK